MPRKSKPTRKPTAPPGGWPTNRREPIVVESPGPRRSLPALDVDNTEILRRRLVWRFSEVDDTGEWPPHEIGATAMGDLLRRMGNFEAMTVGEIFAPGSQVGKTYEVESLPKKVRDRLEEIERDDLTELARLRCGARPRLYGVLREHIFHVLWWDADHAVYPSKKKHT